MFYQILSYTELVMRWRPRKPLIGLDVGSKFIGVAISDSSTSLAVPFNVYTRSEDKPLKAGKEITHLIEKYQVQAAIVGAPFTDTFRTNKILDYVESVWTSHNLQIPIVLQDEAFSTYEVVSRMHGKEDINHQKLIRKMSKKQKLKVDKYAACVILTRGLEKIDQTFEELAKHPNWMQKIEQYKQKLEQGAIIDEKNTKT